MPQIPLLASYSSAGVHVEGNLVFHFVAADSQPLSSGAASAIRQIGIRQNEIRQIGSAAKSANCTRDDQPDTLAAAAFAIVCLNAAGVAFLRLGGFRVVAAGHDYAHYCHSLSRRPDRVIDKTR
ncbi:MAG: hypothetical protein WD971_11000 [Pirellulales bacterium]